MKKKSFILTIFLFTLITVSAARVDQLQVEQAKTRMEQAFSG